MPAIVSGRDPALHVGVWHPADVSSDPVDVLAAGSDLLRPLLESHRFVQGVPEEGSASGGYFARVRWMRDAQYLDTHVRHGLGIVVYGWGDDEFTHQEYLRLLGLRGAYPGYSRDDPLDNFRRLLDDLEGPAERLLVMTKNEFVATAEAIRRLPQRVLP